MSSRGNNYLDVDFTLFKNRASLMKKTNNLFVKGVRERKITKKGGKIEIQFFKNIRVFIWDIVFTLEKNGFSSSFVRNEEENKYVITLVPKRFSNKGEKQ